MSFIRYFFITITLSFITLHSMNTTDKLIRICKETAFGTGSQKIDIDLKLGNELKKLSETNPELYEKMVKVAAQKSYSGQDPLKRHKKNM